jgi:hypothetical protein
LINFLSFESINTVTFDFEDLIDYEEDSYPDNSCIGLTEERLEVNSVPQLQSPLQLDNQIRENSSREDSVEIVLGPPPTIGSESWTRISDSREVIAKKKQKKSESSFTHFC